MTLEPLSSKVLVTAQTLPLDAESSPAPVTILTREEILQRAATSLPDLLATQPGFSLGRSGAEGGETSLFLDGGNSNHTKVLVDGTPVNQPGGLVDFSNFTLDNIEKIEIVHGGRKRASTAPTQWDGVIQIFHAPRNHAHSGIHRLRGGGKFLDGTAGGADLSGDLVGNFDYSAEVVVICETCRARVPTTCLPQSHALRNFWLAVQRYCARQSGPFETTTAAPQVPPAKTLLGAAEPDRYRFTAGFQRQLARRVHNRVPLAPSIKWCRILLPSI